MMNSNFRDIATVAIGLVVSGGAVRAWHYHGVNPYLAAVAGFLGLFIVVRGLKVI